MAPGALAGAALGLALALSGCSTTGGDVATQWSSPGAVHIAGDVNIIKNFGGCIRAASGFQAEQDAGSTQGADLSANAATQTGALGLDSAAALVAGLAALDECDASDIEKLIEYLEGAGYIVTEAE